MLINSSRRRSDWKSASDLECPQYLIASSTKYGTGLGGLPDPTTLQISSFHQVLLQLLNERQFGFHFRKFAVQYFALWIHAYNSHILHYRHRTCLFVRKPSLLSSRAIQDESFIVSFSKRGVKGCPGGCKFSTQQSCRAQAHDKWNTLY